MIQRRNQSFELCFQEIKAKATHTQTKFVFEDLSMLHKSIHQNNVPPIDSHPQRYNIDASYESVSTAHDNYTEESIANQENYPLAYTASDNIGGQSCSSRAYGRNAVKKHMQNAGNPELCQTPLLEIDTNCLQHAANSSQAPVSHQQSDYSTKRDNTHDPAKRIVGSRKDVKRNRIRLAKQARKKSKMIVEGNVE